MDRMLYVAMSGAKQIMQAQAVTAHNLANISTTGFRADLTAARSMPLQGGGQPSRVYPMSTTAGTETASGKLITTGRDLDVAVNDKGWIAVQTPDGREAYTRAGNMRVTETGQLLTGSGHPVLGNAGAIAIPPAEKLEIGDDGTVSIRPLGQQPQALAVIDRIKLVNPESEQLVKGSDGLMHLKSGGVSPPDAGVSLVSGTLESSNVNAVEQMVSMLELARQFEMQVKMMSTAQEMDSSSAQLMRIR